MSVFSLFYVTSSHCLVLPSISSFQPYTVLSRISYPILSYHIISYHILLHPPLIFSYHTLPYPALPYPTLPYPTLPYRCLLFSHSLLPSPILPNTQHISHPVLYRQCGGPVVSYRGRGQSKRKSSLRCGHSSIMGIRYNMILD